jgi:hypothetical protein
VSLGIKYIDLGKMQEILKVGLECNFSETSEEHENRLQIVMTKSFICMFLIAWTNQ